MSEQKQVICVDNSSWGLDLLTIGKIYDVSQVVGMYTFVNDDKGNYNTFYSNRFKDVILDDIDEDTKEMPEEPYVKCINNTGRQIALTVGKVYEVLQEERDRYYVIDDNEEEHAYFKHRFEIIDPKPKEDFATPEHSYIEVNEVVKRDLKVVLSHFNKYFSEHLNNLLNESDYKGVTEIASFLESFRYIENQL